MRTSESVKAIAPALLKAQRSMQAAAMSAVNPHFKSKYADLATIIDATKGPLNEQAVICLQGVTSDSSGVMVETTLMHESGEWIADTLFMPVPQQTPQAYGSAITYGRCYGLQALVCLPAEDDDGNKASEAPSGAAKLVADGPPRKLPKQYFVDFCTAMPDVADDEDQLRCVFSDAIRAARAVGDASAEASFMQKKDQLKEAAQVAVSG